MVSKKELKEILDEAGAYLSIVPGDPKSLLFGDWDSRFIGDGLEFEEFREYREGDNPKRIHAAMSSRMGKPMVVRHLEPREARMLIVLDISLSMMVRDKIKTAFMALSMIFSSGFDIHMPISIWGVGSNKELRMMPPIDHGLLDYVIDAIISKDSNNPFVERRVPEMNLDDWMSFLPGGSLIFVISDFLGSKDKNLKQLFEPSLYGYKVVPIIIQDEFEYSFPELPFGADIPILDPETGSTEIIKVNKSTALDIKEKHEERFFATTSFFESMHMRFTHLDGPKIDKIYEKIERALL